MTRTPAELLAAHCRPLEGGRAMGVDAVRAQLAAVPGWEADANSIARRYAFADYAQTIAFVNAVAWVFHREDHHPELTIGYDRVRVRFDTHSVGGISENDFICAAKCDALYADRPKAPSS